MSKRKNQDAAIDHELLSRPLVRTLLGQPGEFSARVDQLLEEKHVPLVRLALTLPPPSSTEHVVPPNVLEHRQHVMRQFLSIATEAHAMFYQPAVFSEMVSKLVEDTRGVPFSEMRNDLIARIRAVTGACDSAEVLWQAMVAAEMLDESQLMTASSRLTPTPHAPDA